VTSALSALADHRVDRTLTQLFADDPERADRFVVEVGRLRIDYSKQPIDDALLAALST
jgi:glucose-6-phosphate isomerase